MPKPSNDSRSHIGLSGIRTCDHLQASPEIYHSATALTMLSVESVRDNTI